jgi:organic radical activating enzyme
MTYDSLTHEQSGHQNYFVINWCISNVCNFSCSYCPEGCHNHSVGFPHFETVRDFCRAVMKHHRGKQLYFEFTGGEVTLWRDLPRLLQFFAENKTQVGIISNGSRSMDWWSAHGPLMSHVCLSYHSEFAKAEHYLRVAAYLSQHTSLHCNIMMNPSRFDECLRVANQLVEIRNISVALQPLVHDLCDDLYDYTPEQLRAIEDCEKDINSRIKWDRPGFTYRGRMQLRKNGKIIETLNPHQLIARKLNNWEGWECEIGNEQLVVDLLGNVLRGWCAQGGIVGNIHDLSLKFPSSPIVCRRDHCHCNLDIMTTKRSKELMS